jgi:hypothetical protein
VLRLSVVSCRVVNLDVDVDWGASDGNETLCRRWLVSEVGVQKNMNVLKLLLLQQTVWPELKRRISSAILSDSEHQHTKSFRGGR